MFLERNTRAWLFTFLFVVILSTPLVVAGIDEASRYSGSGGSRFQWVNGGHKGDLELSPWVLEAMANGGVAGWTIADSALGGGDVNTDGKSFALFASPNINPVPYAAATRKFAKSALSTGDSLTFRMAVNYRSPGNRGFDLRSGGVGIWNFSIRSGGYYVNGDGGASLGAYHSNTVFEFNFTQRERVIDYRIRRSGGIVSEVSGTIPAVSGTWEDLRFYISGAGDVDGARNYLYFNSFDLIYADRKNEPLTLGERRIPGSEPSYLLRFSDPVAQSVTLRHGGDWNTSHVLTKGGDGIWSIDVRNLNLAQGWHDFKFRLDGVYEGGENRKLYVDEQGRVAQPPAVYLTWQADPTSTMTICWVNDDESDGTLRYRETGQSTWTERGISAQPAPHTNRYLRSGFLEGLKPDTEYEFTVSGYDSVYRFKTAPSRIESPVKFIVTGDIDANSTADAMARTAAGQDPLFIAVIGDHAYEDSKADSHWKWARYFESWHRWFRGSNGRLIPIVPGVGNHEMLFGMVGAHSDFDNTADWRRRYGNYYYRYFPFPGASQPYGTLDFGNYLSLVILDTEHSSPTITGSDDQSLWLGARLAERSTVRHILPMYHVPAYPSNRAFSDPLNARIRSAWLPLLENAGVKLAFEHHDHTYKRTKPMKGGQVDPGGTVFMGDGAWGVSTRSVDTTRNYLERAAAANHAIVVTLGPTSRQVNVIDLNGTIIDSVSQTADYIPPAPGQINPSITHFSNIGIKISWLGSADSDGYRVFRNGILIGSTSENYFVDTQWSAAPHPVYSVRAYNDGGESTDGTTAPDHKHLWGLSNGMSGSPEEIDALMSGDNDGDGIHALAEYFHGTNPNSPESSMPVFLEGVHSGYFRFLYKKSPEAEDVTGRVLTTDNLETGAWVGITGESHEELQGDRAGWYRCSIPLGGGGMKGFYRLKVE